MAEIPGFLTDDLIDGVDGDDALQGGRGNDRLIGGDGWDAASFSGERSQYVVEQHNGFITVMDSVAGRDGTDTLYDIEELRFDGGEGEDVDLETPNRVPVAAQIEIDATEDTRLTISPSLILTAASDPDGDEIGLVSVSNAVGGRVSINLDGDIVFEPSLDFFGLGQFDYAISDGRGGVATGTVKLNVEAIGDAPRISGVMSDVFINEDTPINVLIPSGLFVEPDGQRSSLLR